jgi:ribosomal protein S18 acetylase RimI-like enzyme
LIVVKRARASSIYAPAMDDPDLQPERVPTEDVEVRELRTSDLEWVTRIDAAYSGRVRHAYYRVKLYEAEHDTGVRISLAAMVHGQPAGFLMARLYYGEFGVPDPVAQLDSLGVAKEHARHHVAAALLAQLRTNLRGLRIERIETQVAWDQMELLSFFHHAGFRPASRLCLESAVQSE